MIGWTNILMAKSKRVTKNGHLYLDNAIATAISRSGFFDHNMITYHGAYLKLLERKQNEAGKWAHNMLPFIKGYCCAREVAARPAEEVNYELVSEGYHSFDKFLSAQGMDSELGFVAAWKAAALGAQLDLSWSEAEERLLAATEAHPERGEAIREILHHYVSGSDYRIAYIYSSYCQGNFWGNVPRRENKWLVDLSFYNWQVLEYHIPCCYALMKEEEALETYKLLTRIMRTNPDYFLPEDIHRLAVYTQWFQREREVAETEGYDKILQK